MLTPSQQKRVWENMLAAEIRSDYFADLSNGYRWHQRLANWLSLCLSSGAFLSLMLKVSQNQDGSSNWVLPSAFAFGSAAISAYSVVAQNHDRATAGMDLHARWNRLAKDYQKLWDDMYDEAARDRLEKLEEVGTELSKAGISFPYKKRRMLKWQAHVEQHHATV